ncbi:porin [Paraburkholderia antibiotica]|uniref:Porin n=1 Tax=Paraburkholderia antibiotica TaxID=2728839 RepID=A0A7X9X5J3_9BURK|nr:porin [Paraburkholderia antibiotica]NML31841.1 porin [Paraburkholderia antibiotica]
MKKNYRFGNLRSIKIASLACTSIALSANSAHAAATSGDDSSSVSLYGLIGTYVVQSKLSTTPNGSVQMGGGGFTTSYWGVSGKEALGGGTSVIFKLESFFRPNTGQMGRNTTDGLFSRNAYVGLANNTYGSFKVGLQTTQTYINQSMLNPFGSSVVFSPLIVQSYVAGYNGQVIGDTVWGNTLGYYSPSFYGLTGAVQYSVSSVTGQQGRDNLGLHLMYERGPFQAALSAQRVRGAPNSPGVDQTLYLAGATYNAQFAKFYSAVQTTNTTTSHVGTHTYQLGVSVPVTPVSAILASWALTRLRAPSNRNSVHNTGSIAYDYYLSKRTDVYGVYSYDRISTHPSGSTYGVGVRHVF